MVSSFAFLVLAAMWNISTAYGFIVTTRVGRYRTIGTRTAMSNDPFLVNNLNRRTVIATTSFTSMGLMDAYRAFAEGKNGGLSKPTNEVVSQINGIRQKRLGGTDILVSEIGLGTQRWASADFNGPDENLCLKLMDSAILNDGINLVDTAEQYPIPSDASHPEGLCEEIIGKWISSSKGRREKIVIATKITGGTRISKRGIADACEGSLKRLKTDYIDLFQFHWPARYTPQSNWGQSLEYKQVWARFLLRNQHIQAFMLKGRCVGRIKRSQTIATCAAHAPSRTNASLWGNF
jgi:hypothetical protein